MSLRALFFPMMTILYAHVSRFVTSSPAASKHFTFHNGGSSYHALGRMGFPTANPFCLLL
ncbi:hypothetical protein M758_7G053000 [Ceratodon purpureus]|nr:hypothetical protein M758_7G053000 [Ceratodon purpureus]